MLFAFVALTALSSENPLKGALMIALGAFLSTIGIDRIAGVQRFTMDIPVIMYGIDFVPVAIGVFGIAEVIRITFDPYAPPPMKSVRFRELYPNREETRRSIMPILRGSLIGAFFGLLPGTPQSWLPLHPIVWKKTYLYARKSLATEPLKGGRPGICK